MKNTTENRRFRQTNNHYLADMFRIVPQNSGKQILRIVGVVGADQGPGPLLLEVGVDGLKGLLRPLPQASLAPHQFNELYRVSLYQVNLWRYGNIQDTVVV